MDTPKINVNMPENFDGTTPIVIHLLEGQTKDPVNISSLEIAGNIDAVSAFIDARVKNGQFKKMLQDDCKSYIIMDVEGQYITLIMDEKHPHKTTVKAKLEQNPELSKFGINAGTRYSPTELASVIKLNRAYFNSYDDHQAILSGLKNVSAKIGAEIINSNDDRGIRSLKN